MSEDRHVRNELILNQLHGGLFPMLDHLTEIVGDDGRMSLMLAAYVAGFLLGTDEAITGDEESYAVAKGIFETARQRAILAAEMTGMKTP